MKEKTEINAVEMVRAIRDQHAEWLKGKSRNEIMAFFKTPRLVKPEDHESCGKADNSDSGFTADRP